MERHRLLALWLADHRQCIEGQRVLHFAPEPTLQKLIRPLASRYLSADIAAGRADRQLDITAIDLPDASFDVIVCSHVLEHVDDASALAEMRRILTPGGIAILLTPIVSGWDRTYENPSVADEEGRWLHFGQGNHVRLYGRDVVERIARAGFEVTRFVAVEPHVSRYGLTRGETLLLATPSR